MVLVLKNPSANTGDVRDMVSILGQEDLLEEGNTLKYSFFFSLIYLLLQYSCLENPMDRGSWWATVHSIAKTWIQLKQLSMHAYMRISKPHKDMNEKQHRSHPQYNPQSLFSNPFFLRV